MTSTLVHGGVIGLLLLLSGPVWRPAGKRTVSLTMARVPAPAPVRLKRATVLPRRRVDVLVAAPVSPALRALVLPAVVPAPARAALRIEAPAEMAQPVALPLPAVAAPVIAVKPLVQVGSLESPAVAAGARTRAVASTGFDAGGAQSAGIGRQATSAGFDVVAGGAAGGAVTRTARTVSAGFDAPEAMAAKTVAHTAVSAFEGIEILEKPRPLYTDEARRLRVEGTVRLRVVFSASGRLRVVAVVKGLGHGLDEAAAEAAEAIRFRPARRDGHSVDAPAVIEIQFQIA